jgi:PAS domain S-box-containing protein
MAVKKTITRSQEFSDSVIDTIREPLIALDQDLRVVNASRSFYKVFKANPEETVGRLIYDLGNKQWDIPKLRELLETILPEKATFDNYEVERDFAGIGSRIMLLNARQIERAWGKEKIILLAIEDITDRKRLEDLLTDSEDLYRSVFKNASDGILLLEKSEGRVTHINTTAEKMLGYSAKESIGSNLQDIGFMLKDDFQTIMQELNTNGIVNYADVVVTAKSGQPIDADIYIVNKTRVVQCNIRDIAERKQAEEMLKKSEKKYRLLADHMKDQVWIMDLNLKMTYISPSVEKLLGYTFDELKHLPLDKVLTAPSIQTAMEHFSIQMSRALPISQPSSLKKLVELEFICKNGQILWGECSFSFIRDKNGKPLSILGEAREITERKEAEENLLLTVESLKKAFVTIIQVMVSAVEMRDPYTAGHQLRVANLACAIATEMGLLQDKIEGILMAGSIHDIGKLSIPSEILSKPSKLTNLELLLIKEHSRNGYEMLKNVESPWPLAQIVYQHHERMDGSGYPRNLKGDEIRMEARIMAVADVVEAMASHRPYRAALGIEAALEEIGKNKGILYDAIVADACLKLFREKGYKLLA